MSELGHQLAERGAVRLGDGALGRVEDEDRRAAEGAARSDPLALQAAEGRRLQRRRLPSRGGAAGGEKEKRKAARASPRAIVAMTDFADMADGPS